MFTNLSSIFSVESDQSIQFISVKSFEFNLPKDISNFELIRK